MLDFVGVKPEAPRGPWKALMAGAFFLTVSQALAPSQAIAHGSAQLQQTAAATAQTTPVAEPAPWDAAFQAALSGCVSNATPGDIEKVRLLSGLSSDRFPLVALINTKFSGAVMSSAKPGDPIVETYYSQGMIQQYGFNFSQATFAFLKVLTLDLDAVMAY